MRLEARRLRRDLASYYIGEGRRNPLRIAIPKGHYAPEVRPADEGGADLRRSAWAPGEVPASPAHAQDRSPPVAARPAWLRPALGWGSLLVAILALAIVGYSLRQDPSPEVVQTEQGPSVLVWPFSARGGSPEDQYLAAGISDQIITGLSRYPDIRLFIPPAGALLDRSEDPVVASDRLGISFLVSGSISSDASAVRIGSRVIDVKSGRVLWSEDFEEPRSVETLLAAQAEIASAIATTLGQPYGVIKNEITSRLPPGPAPSMPSYECVLRAYAYRRTFDTALHAPLLACLRAAVEKDTDYAEAWAMLGWLYMDEGRFNLVRDGNMDAAYRRGLEAASHAVAIDGRNVLALKALASIYHYMGNFDEGERIQRQALALNPNDPDTLAQLGWRLAVRGKFDEGIPFLSRAIERTVNPPGWYHHLIAVDHYLKGRLRSMLDAARNGAIDGSGTSWSFVAIAEGALGNTAKAREALDRMVRVQPRFATDPGAVYRMHGATDEIADALVAGLRKAGWSPQVADGTSP